MSLHFTSNNSNTSTKSLVKSHFEAAVLADSKTKDLSTVLQLLQSDNSLVTELWEYEEFFIFLIQIIISALSTEKTREVEKAQEIRNLEIVIQILAICVKNSSIKRFIVDSSIDSFIYPFMFDSTDEAFLGPCLDFFQTLVSDGLPDGMRGREIIPLLLKITDIDKSDIEIKSLNVLCDILQGKGLDYAVQTLDRFNAIDVVLRSLFVKALKKKNIQVLRILIKIYSHICEKHNALLKVKEKLPEGIEGADFNQLCLKDKELSELRRRFFKIVK